MRNFFFNKKILILGHTGFKGIWLVSILRQFKAKVYGISLNDEKRKHYRNCITDNEINNYYFNILNKKKLEKTIYKINPQIIFHLAAQSIVRNSFDKPVQTFETNFNGTLYLLQIVRKLKSLKSVIIATSDKCYLNNEKKYYFKEEDPLGGDDPYSASKGAVEILTRSFYRSFLESRNIGVATVRAGNVLGGCDMSDDRIIPDSFRSIFKKKHLILRYPNSIRPWQHVLDVLNGYLILSKKLYLNQKKFSGPWNFGPHEKKLYSVHQIVKFFFIYIGCKKNIKIKKISGIREKKILLLNSKKALKHLKWKNKLTITKTIKLVAEWYKAFLKSKDTKIILSRQIKDYFS